MWSSHKIVMNHIGPVLCPCSWSCQDIWNIRQSTQRRSIQDSQACGQVHIKVIWSMVRSIERRCSIMFCFLFFWAKNPFLDMRECISVHLYRVWRIFKELSESCSTRTARYSLSAYPRPHGGAAKQQLQSKDLATNEELWRINVLFTRNCFKT